MLKESSNNQNENKYLNTANIPQENIICKDGFCSLQNQKDISKKEKNDKDFFDPIR